MTRPLLQRLLLALLFSLALPGSAALELHPENPRYFLWRGKPTVIVTSGEHYGALVNLDFDFKRYFDTLHADGLNGTRIFAGAYAETGGNFNIQGNTLNPAPGRFIAPWARSSTPGYADGGNKFDLNRWDPAYFKRLHSLMRHASRRGIIVELNLFCPMYEDSMWSVCPMNGSNNVNNLGHISRNDVLTLNRNGGLLAIQEAMVRKLVEELAPYDNLYYEICNEPYVTGVPLDWQQHMIGIVHSAQRDHPRKKLVSLNIANQSALVPEPIPGVSIYNFHYATPPDVVALNAHLNLPIGDNETGFRGTNNTVYRTEAWDFMVAGGALFNHLDYSFTVGHEDGTFPYPATQPGGGNPTLRKQFAFLHRELQRFNLPHTQPHNQILIAGIPRGGTSRALVEPNSTALIYTRRGAATNSQDGPINLTVNWPAGSWRADWLNPVTCEIESSEVFHHPGGQRTLRSPEFLDDIALRIRRQP